MFNPGLYVITDHRLPDEALLVRVATLAEVGVTCVQLRDKLRPPEKILFLARSLQELLRPWGIPLLINDYPEVAREVGAEGVHLGTADMAPEKARELLGNRAIIGCSVESPDRMAELPWGVLNYVAASPVYPTLTKPDCAPPLGEGLREICRRSPLPVVGIGGIREQNIERVLQAGACGIAVCSALMSGPRHGETAEKFLRTVNRHRRAQCHTLI